MLSNPYPDDTNAPLAGSEAIQTLAGASAVQACCSSVTFSNDLLGQIIQKVGRPLGGIAQTLLTCSAICPV